MKQTDNFYIELGRKYENGKTAGDTLRHYLEKEKVHDRADCRRLIDQGRREAHTIKPQ
jgi:hypothetical protein